MSYDYDTARPYIASYAILTKNGKVAFVLRSNTGWKDGFYSLPAGKVEKEESYSKGAIREAKEEVGVTIKPEDLKHILTLHRTHGKEADPMRDWVDVFFEAIRWEGEPYNAEPDKHSELTWLDPKNLPKNVLPYISKALSLIEEGKTYGEYGWED